MKTKRYFLIFAWVLWASSVLANAQIERDVDERTELTFDEVQTFLKQRLPEAIALLEHVRKHEPIHHYNKAMEEAAEMVQNYRETVSNEGKETADRELRRHRLELQIESLTIVWRRARNEDSRSKARDALKNKVVERFDHELRMTKIELELLRNEVTDIEAEIKDLETNRDQRISAELEAIRKEGERDKDGAHAYPRGTPYLHRITAEGDDIMKESDFDKERLLTLISEVLDGNLDDAHRELLKAKKVNFPLSSGY